MTEITWVMLTCKKCGADVAKIGRKPGIDDLRIDFVTKFTRSMSGSTTTKTYKGGLAALNDFNTPAGVLIFWCGYCQRPPIKVGRRALEAELNAATPGQHAAQHRVRR